MSTYSYNIIIHPIPGPMIPCTCKYHKARNKVDWLHAACYIWKGRKTCWNRVQAAYEATGVILNLSELIIKQQEVSETEQYLFIFNFSHNKSCEICANLSLLYMLLLEHVVFFFTCCTEPSIQFSTSCICSFVCQIEMEGKPLHLNISNQHCAVQLFGAHPIVLVTSHNSHHSSAQLQPEQNQLE